MKLVHFSTERMPPLRSIPDQSEARTFKPRGLWLSDEDAEQSWSKWCRAEDFGLGEITTEFELVADHNVLILDTASSLRDFTTDFRGPRQTYSMWVIDWQRVADKYQGLLITPYQWSLRLDSHVDWYYPWDCASACVWDTTVLRQVTP